MTGGPTGVNVSRSAGVQLGDGNTQVNLHAGADGLLPPPADVPAPAGTHNLPHPAGGVFVGRDAALAQLAGALAAVRGAIGPAVHGLGGIGKTELALRYAHAHADRFTLIWWITADSPERILLGLAGLTRRLHPAASLTDAGEWARAWLQSHSGWLLVLDNVERAEDVADLLAQAHPDGRVLVTTRRDLGARAWRRLRLAPLRLAELDRAASVELLTTVGERPDETGDAGLLAADLGDLPLALEQAGAYIAQHDLPIARYRALLAERPDRMYDTVTEGVDATRTIRRVWQLTMGVIAGRSVLAGRVLSILAHLAPDELPEDVLVPLAPDQLDLADALHLLASYSMVVREDGMVSVHRLVQAATRAQAGTGGGPAPADQACLLLHRAIPRNPMYEVSGWPRWNVLLPHVDVLTGYFPAEHRSAELSFLHGQAAQYLAGQGQLDRATALFERCLADRERILGPEAPDTLTARNNLANAYRAGGRLAEAVPLFERTLADRERILGPNHVRTLYSRNNLANAYREADRLVEATALLERTLADSERLLGAGHIDTLISCANLGNAYRDAGRCTDAITILERTLGDLERLLGPDHPRSLDCAGDLAGAYRAAGRFADAIGRYEHTLARCERILGPEHPTTVEVRTDLHAARLAG